MKAVWFIMGLTCCGKTDFLEACEARYEKSVHTLKTGAILRKRYPPEYFEGKMALDKTEAEVMDIFDEHLMRFVETPDAKVLLVDGQPRLPSQVWWNTKRVKDAGVPYRFFLFHAPDAVREKRLQERFPKESSEYSLGVSRMEKDKPMYYDVLATLLLADEGFELIDSSGARNSYQRPLFACVEEIIRGE